MTSFPPSEPPAEPRGVYESVHRTGRIRPEELHVPPFLSRRFLRFMGDFARNPSSNPVFLREWRRHLRRLGPLEGFAIHALVVLGVLFLFGGIGGIFLVRASANFAVQAATIWAILMLPAAVLAVVGFFTSLHANQSIASRAMLEELALTPLHPQQIAFGYIVGTLAPLLSLFAASLPGFALMLFDLGIRDPVAVGAVDGVFAVAMVLWYFPFVFALAVMSSAVAQGVCYGRESSGTALAAAIGTWLVILLVMSIMALYLLGMGFMQGAMRGGGGSMAFLVGSPVLVLMMLAVAAGFLHHLAVRIAQRQADEEPVL